MKFGDAVLFTENGVDYLAIVLSSRIVDHHLGTNEEPVLSLAFFKPVMGFSPSDGSPMELDVAGTSRQNELVQWRTDVVHDSHEFDEAAKVKFGKAYPGGRWKEIPENVSFSGRMFSDTEAKVVPKARNKNKVTSENPIADIAKKG